MSFSLSRASLARVAAILISPTFMPLGGCAHTPRVADAPSPERVAVGESRRPKFSRSRDNPHSDRRLPDAYHQRPWCVMASRSTSLTTK